MLRRVRVSFPFCPVAITAKQSFQKRSENGEALLRLKGDFSIVLGRKKAESRKMLFTVSLSTGKPTVGRTWPWGRWETNPAGEGGWGQGMERQNDDVSVGEQEGSKGWAQGTRSVCAGKYRIQGAVSTARPEKNPFTLN